MEGGGRARSANLGRPDSSGEAARGARFFAPVTI